MNKFDITHHIVDIKKNDIISKKIIPFFGAQLQEIDILILQDLCMTPGVHKIQVSNLASGRSIMTLILNSLNHYQNIAYISDILHDSNIFHQICKNGMCKESLEFAFEEFFIHQPFFDFLIIELTETFKNEKLMEDLLQIFSMFHFQEQLPIFIISYQDK